MSDEEPIDRRTPAEPKSPASSGREAAEAVREVLEDQAERRARQGESGGRKRRKRLLPLPVVGLFWGVACLVVWAATPEFLLPEPIPEPPPERIEAGLRLEMVVLAAEINQFREETGRVPESLERISEDPPTDIRYSPLPPSSYRLTGMRGQAEIVYDSTEPLDQLRGNAREIIRGQVGASS